MASYERKWHSLAQFVLSSALALLFVKAADAQQDRIASIEQSVACFKASYRAECEPGVVPLEWIVVQPEKYPDLYAPALDALAQLASSDDMGVRSRALAWLGGAGETGGPGVVDRLLAVYREAKRPGTRTGIAMELTRQLDTAAAVDALMEIARDQRPEDLSDEFPPALVAISALEKAGPQGRAALERLYAEGQVQNAHARRRLEHLAERGFQVDGGPRQ